MDAAGISIQTSMKYGELALAFGLPLRTFIAGRFSSLRVYAMLLWKMTVGISVSEMVVHSMRSEP